MPWARQQEARKTSTTLKISLMVKESPWGSGWHRKSRDIISGDILNVLRRWGFPACSSWMLLRRYKAGVHPAGAWGPVHHLQSYFSPKLLAATWTPSFWI